MPRGPRRAHHLLVQLLPRERPQPRGDRTVLARTAGAPRVVASSLDRQPAIAVVTAAPTDAFVRDRPDLCVLERPLQHIYGAIQEYQASIGRNGWTASESHLAWSCPCSSIGRAASF